ncbi:MAG: hypothetical protein QNK04_02460 [Myxococcota bacterium]|nr:hypothetical protein [Myxococcota bacterium]
MSRDEAGLRQGLTDELAARVHDPEGAGFSEAEHAVLRALPLMRAESADLALEELRGHFDVGGDRGEIGQIVHAYGLYRGLHATMAVLGAEILDDEGRPLSERPGFGVVTTDDGRFVPRDAIDLP